MHSGIQKDREARDQPEDQGLVYWQMMVLTTDSLVKARDRM